MTDLSRLQLACVLAPGLTRRDLKLASVTAADGSALFVAANRKRNSFWVEGTGHDGVRRHFQMVAHVAGPPPGKDRFPYMINKWSVYENGRRIFRFSVSFSRADKLLGMAAAAFRADGAAATKYVQLMCDGSRASKDGVISMRGIHHGTHFREPLEATVDLRKKGLLHAETPFSRWMEEAFHDELPRLQHFRPLMEYASARYMARWNRLLGLVGLNLNSPPEKLMDYENPFSAKETAECPTNSASPYVVGCCDVQTSTVGAGILCYAATAEASIIDNIGEGIVDALVWAQTSSDDNSSDTDTGDDTGDTSDTSDDSGSDESGSNDGPGSDDSDPGSGGDWGDGGEGGFGGGGCFVRGTKTYTSNGAVGIETVRPGMGVWTYDTTSQEPVLRQVLRAFEHHATEILTLDFGNETVRCTAPHRFYTGVWTAAAKLRIGQRVLNRAGEWLSLQGVTRTTHPQPVFNLSVEGLHNYFVGTAALLVHNEKDSHFPDGDSGWPDDVN
jgi:hypothetical protein